MTDAIRFNRERSDILRDRLIEMVEETAPAERAPWRPSKRTIIIGSIVLGSLAAIGAAATVTAEAGWIAVPSRTPGGSATFAPVPNWPVNAHGQTYGVQGTSPIPPTLIRAQGASASGAPITGYVYSKELNTDQPTPTSPAQALQQQKQLAGKYPDGVKIPLYKSDGSTIIGTFTVYP